ncbi:MAG: TrbC/VirB2 family protein [Burkholderiales bacterium]
MKLAQIQKVILPFVAMSLFPAMANAYPAFAGGISTFQNDLMMILAPVFGIFIIGAGVMAWAGKISWVWFIGLIVGAVLVFGNQQIVTWIRGDMGV